MAIFKRACFNSCVFSLLSASLCQTNTCVGSRSLCRTAWTSAACAWSWTLSTITWWSSRWWATLARSLARNQRREYLNNPFAGMLDLHISFLAGPHCQLGSPLLQIT